MDSETLSPAYISKLFPEFSIMTEITATSIENARKNLEVEIPDWDFEKTKSNLEKTWNNVLAKIDVEGASEEDYTKF